MLIKNKIDEAEFFYKKLEETNNDFVYTEYYFSAFLSSTHSIYDHLLEFYNKKYELGIAINENLTEYSFMKKAIEKESLQAIDFILWYIKKMQENNKIEIWKVLNKKRNINIHRQSENLRVNQVRFDGKIGDQKLDKEIIALIPADGTDHEETKNIVDQILSKASPDTKTIYNWSIDGLGGHDGISGCKEYLDMMKSLVNEAETIFN